MWIVRGVSCKWRDGSAVSEDHNVILLVFIFIFFVTQFSTRNDSNELSGLSRPNELRANLSWP